MKLPHFSLRKLFITFFAVVITLSILAWAVWSLSAIQFKHVIDTWIKEGQEAGYDISYDNREIFGFPRHITMRLQNVHWRNTDGIDFHSDSLDIFATPLDWGNFGAKFKNHVLLQAPLDTKGTALVLASEEGQAFVYLDSKGFWHTAKLSLTDATLGLAPKYLFKASHLIAAASRPEAPPKDHTEVGLYLKGEATDITVPDAMPSPFGNHADKFSMHARVMGDMPDIRERASVEAWNKDSGIVELDDFSMIWGVLDLVSKGTVGFDDDLQPEGAFAGSIAHPETTMQALIDHGFIATHDTAMLDSAMHLFAKPVGKTEGLEFPITVQLGGLFLGPIRIFTFPPIDWPLEPPPKV